MYEFPEKLNRFDKEYTDHFPKTILPHAYTFANIDTVLNERSNFCLLGTYDIDNKFQLYLDSISKNSLYQGSYTDKCLHVRIMTFTNGIFHKISSCEQKNTKIAFIEDGRSMLTMHYKNDEGTLDFEKYLSARPYDFIVLEIDSTHKYIKHLSPDFSMPEGLEHGYSKGILINKKSKEATFWIDIW